ncbi:DNA topoisomerase IV subunit A, partial [bacterium]|nr:DNA topoisomerase IV subunit A [bacterium]
MPLIEVHGNKGSIDDDPAAAMRYTEARLSVYGNEMLSDIDKKIYPFINNFDDTETEPTILSSLLPNLLINGASGIAAGYATSIPTFNIKELLNAIISVIKNKKSSIEDILKIMPGPDFPTKGMIINYDEIKKFYLTGEGKITIRSNYYFQKAEKKEKDKIVITDIPYETIKCEIVKQIEELRINNKLPGILSVIDATDKNGINIELELINDKVNVVQIMNFLYKKTQLQVNFSANMIVINERKPIRIGVLDYINLYINYAINTIIKVQQYLLNEDENRYEIVLGLIKALSILDEIIAIIRKSNDKADSIKNLVRRFQFSNKQAEAIVSLRLYRL